MKLSVLAKPPNTGFILLYRSSTHKTLFGVDERYLYMHWSRQVDDDKIWYDGLFWIFIYARMECTMLLLIISVSQKWTRVHFEFIIVILFIIDAFIMDCYCGLWVFPINNKIIFVIKYIGISIKYLHKLEFHLDSSMLKR